MPKKKHSKKRKTSNPKSDAAHSSSIRLVFLSSLFGAVLALAVMLALILLFCAVALAFEYPHKFLTPLSLFSLGAAAFFGGMIATRKNGGSALLCGLLSGALLLLTLKILTVIIPVSQAVSASELTAKLLSLSALPLSALGAFLGVPQSKNKSRHK